MSRPRPLPRSLAAHPGESLAGYLLNLSARLCTTPAAVAARVGLLTETPRKVSRLELSLGLRLPQDKADALVAACRLDPAEVRGLTVARWENVMLHPATVAGTRSEDGRAWLNLARTRACPQCLLREDGEHDDDGPRYTTWQVAWRTPWAFACPAHHRLLIDACPSCLTPLGQARIDAKGKNGGLAVHGLIPSMTTAGLHPAACRARTTAGHSRQEAPRTAALGRVCGHRLDDGQDTSIRPDESVLLAQSRLSALLDSTFSDPVSLGVPVSPAQYLRDVRLLAFALQATQPQQWPVPPPVGTEAAVRRNAVASLDRTASTGSRMWVSPPADAGLTAALLTVAVRLLDEPTLAAARPLLQPLVAAVSGSPSASLWSRVRATAEPSPGLRRSRPRRLRGS